MFLTRALILISLSGIFVQDLKGRAVYWIWFPLLIILFFTDQMLMRTSIAAITQNWLVNMLFLLPQLMLLTLYFSLKEKRWVNITANLLGWGDVLLLVSLGFYFSLPAFVLFYLSGLVLVMLSWAIWQYFTIHKSQFIPLAGMQAMLFAMLLLVNWTVLHLKLNNENALLPFLGLWN